MRPLPGEKRLPLLFETQPTAVLTNNDENSAITKNFHGLVRTVLTKEPSSVSEMMVIGIY
jgi:hypothetical protein